MTSRSRASSLSRSSRPTTPLRRLSSTSLRAHSLSYSASRAPSSTEHPLAHLSLEFTDLANAVSDLTANFDDLDKVHQRLEGVNDAFAGWLLGLRANGYTVDFLEAPTRLNFDLAAERAQLASEAAALAFQQQQATHSHGHHAGDDSLSSPPRSPHTLAQSDATFVTNDDESFTGGHQGGYDAPSAARGRGRGSGIARGRGGGAAGGRGGKVGAVSKRRKEEMAAFADPIMPLLPISLRENRRIECEKVLWALRERPQGVVMADLTAALATGGSTSVPQVRINECLLALVRAKVAIKQLSKGVTTYRLDPNKYPS
ncbi:DASH complex subunit dam1 [Rhodotorula kratochvilovae]